MKVKRFILLTATLVFFAACVYVDGDASTPPAGAQVQPLSHMEAVTIGAGTPWALNGMLNIPDHASAQNPVPAVVIVQGSGPSDMDGNLGELNPFYPAHPYLDIARHLADNGIAVIRHDKRTLTHGEAMMTQPFTLYEEAIADALLATEILRADPRIDNDRIFILGHSMGGVVIPRVHLMGGDFAGLIFMAASPASMIDLIERQMNDQISTILNDPASDEALIAATLAAQAELAPLIAQAQEVQAQIPSMTAEEAQQTPIFILGSSAYYYWDMQMNQMGDLIPQIAAPMLVLQPARDFQVTMEHDWPLMQEIFGQLPNATMRVYENLNHMFSQSTATNHWTHALEISTTQVRVDRGVLEGIVNWINAN